MQNKKMKTEIIMLPVPAELFLEAGVFEGDPMQMYADGHKIVIENIDDPKDIVCDGDCENCPIADIDCDGDCEDCPCSDNLTKARRTDMTKLYRVLGKRGRITIPFEIRQRVGFTYNDVLSFTESPDGRTVTVKREKICDNCSGAKTADKETEMTLEDFLDSLSAEQQRVALVHLSVKWAEQKAGGHNAGA